MTSVPLLPPPLLQYCIAFQKYTMYSMFLLEWYAVVEGTSGHIVGSGAAFGLIYYDETYGWAIRVYWPKATAIIKSQKIRSKVRYIFCFIQQDQDHERWTGSAWALPIISSIRISSMKIMRQNTGFKWLESSLFRSTTTICFCFHYLTRRAICFVVYLWPLWLGRPIYDS